MSLRRIAAALVVVASQFCFAGGPLAVGSPILGTEGQPLTWGAMPIHYTVDSGPMSSTIPNSTALIRVSNMLNNWHNVATAAISFTRDGFITATGAFAGGDVVTISDFNAVYGSCKSSQQNPIIFDANGSLFKALGYDSNIIGFAGACAYSSAGKITAGLAMLNGQMQDGVSTSANPEISSGEFDEAIVHEIGHFLGLDHSQINLQIFPAYAGNCPAD